MTAHADARRSRSAPEPLSSSSSSSLRPAREGGIRFTRILHTNSQPPFSPLRPHEAFPSPLLLLLAHHRCVSLAPFRQRRRRDDAAASLRRPFLPLRTDKTFRFQPPSTPPVQHPILPASLPGQGHNEGGKWHLAATAGKAQPKV
ncbi:hypothetical protein CDD83_11246 [Cordyceps sp. RAO-2017]|nr:hypothetical protein CDD83_11246 [Cordyceps sp. RAO-2017]